MNTLTQEKDDKMLPFVNKRRLLLSYKDMRIKQTKRIKLGERLTELFDTGSFMEMYADFNTKDPLEFPGYKEKLQENERKTNKKDALVCGIGKLGGVTAAGAELDKHFFMGSMGSVVGEKLAMITEEADRLSAPLIIFSSSGGARMQEGMFSLYQMAKTAAAIKRFREKGGLYISVLTHPTTGGVSASFAMLGDIIIAEPGALIGFAGPRVIEQTIGKKLPPGFQSSEFQLEHGFADMIVSRSDMPGMIRRLLRLHGYV